MASAAPLVKAAVHFEFTAAMEGQAVDGTDLAVTYGLPDVPEAESVGVGRVEVEKSRGAMAVQEQRGRVEFFVFSAVGGQTQEEADERAYALLDLLEARLLADNTLGGAVTDCHLVSDELDEFISPADGSDPGRWARIKGVIEFLAHVEAP